MADLKIFGTTFESVSGIKAEDSNGNTATYIQPTGSISITENGENIDVSGYASATVNVPGGTTPTGTKSISANGTDIDVAEYAYVDVDVPNSYSAGDEGKVVSSGALVSQSSDTCTANGTVDTTLINSLSVSVPNTYSSGDEGKVVSSGELVSQSSTSYNSNGTYDTTLYNSVTVNVSGSWVGTVLKTYTVENSPSIITQVLTASEIAEYPVIFAFYDLTVSARDFMYFNIDSSAKNDNNRMYDTKVVEHTGVQGLMLSLPYYNSSNILQKPEAFLYLCPRRDGNGYASYGVSVLTKDSSDHTFYWIPETASNTFESGKITIVGYKYTSL